MNDNTKKIEVNSDNIDRTSILKDRINFYRDRIATINNNPMLSGFELNFGSSMITTKEILERLESNLEKVINHEIPEEYYDMEHSMFIQSSMYRDMFISIQGYALVAKNWVRELLPLFKGKKVLEVMAGYGTISYALKSIGNVDVKTTDNYSWFGSDETSKPFDSSFVWCDIEQISSEDAIAKYNPDYIIMSWAPYESDAAYNTLMKMREINPNCRLIVIGEGRNGCTANEKFFDAIEYEQNCYIDKANRLYPRWFGIHDELRLVK